MRSSEGSGKGKHFFGALNGLVDCLVAGWSLSGFLTPESGRPMTAYSGSSTVSSVRQTPADCNGFPRSMSPVLADPASSFIFYFTADLAAKFSTPAPGSFSNTGHNYFRGPGLFDIDMALAKNIYFSERYYLELCANASNLLNHPSFSFPTLTITTSTFGQIKTSTYSTVGFLATTSATALLWTASSGCPSK